ncbi:MAG: TetR/AcrR family transcriptional regulator [Deltaproteobacteria bacterium]|nr:TetR/AcrR family transcriptional regulator [Deltaproteobacteria bacterium]
MKSKKDKIIDAAIDLFAEKGFGNTSTAKIAVQAEVAQGTLFYHFKNKEGILCEVLRQVLDQTTEACRAIPHDGTSGYTCIETLLRTEVAIIQQQSKKVMVLIRDMTDEVHHPGTVGHELIESFLTFKINLLCQFLRKGIADHSIRPLAVEETAWLLDAAFYGVIHTKLLKSFAVPPLEEHAIQFCLYALTPQSTQQT